MVPEAGVLTSATATSFTVGAAASRAAVDVLWPVWAPPDRVGQHGVEPAQACPGSRPPCRASMADAVLIPDPDAVVVHVACHDRVAEHQRRAVPEPLDSAAPPTGRGRRAVGAASSDRRIARAAELELRRAEEM